jgi:hypothetical protein
MEERFLAGKHGPGIAPGQGAPPVCIDCHVIHDHKPVAMPGAASARPSAQG